MVDFTKSWDEIVEVNDGVPFEKSEQEVDTKKFQEQALDTLTTKDFINTLKDYYTYRDGNDFQYTDDADVLDYFYSDRTWRNNNTVSMTRDLATVMGEDDDLRLQQFAKINNVYQNLPNFWNDPNRDFGDWLKDFGGALYRPCKLNGCWSGWPSYKASL